MSDLTPSMNTALATIGDRSVTADDIGANGWVLKRLHELGFLKIDMERQGRLPPYYSLSEKGEGAAAVLNAFDITPDYWEGDMARIKRTVAAHYHIPLIEMISARRARPVARPRQVAMYLAKQVTPRSLPDIGRHFGNRDHTTVIHAVRTVERLCAADADFAHEVSVLREAVDA